MGIARGVPPGSVLDPTLVSIFSNDSDSGGESMLISFADDATRRGFLVWQPAKQLMAVFTAAVSTCSALI